VAANIIGKLLLVAISLIVSLFLVELVVRILGLYQGQAGEFVQPNPVLGWSHIPDKEGYWTVGERRIHIKINSLGLRDREYTYNKGKGVFRILVLGDSFTEGFQVPLEDTFCKLLEEKLNKKKKGEDKKKLLFEVINAGFAGVGTDYELLFLRREGYKYDPDLVLVVFCPNDVADNYRSNDILKDEQNRLAYEKRGFLIRLKGALAKRSHAYNYIGYVLPNRFPRFAHVLMKIGLLSSQPIDNASGVEQLHYLVFEQEYGPQWEEAWRVTRVLFSELKDETAKRGSNLALVSIPFREQVYKPLWRSMFSGSEMARRHWTVDKPDRLLAQIANDEGIPIFQLLPLFRRAGVKTELYYNGDGHWNIEGHRLAAQLICEWLIEEKLVPVDAGDFSFSSQEPE
jgi:lysophospholipase L1-like esterase